MDDPAALRAFLLFGPFLLGAGLWLYRRPGRRERTGVLFALFWNTAGLLAVNEIAVRAGWWSFEVEGGALLGVPIDLLLGWSVLWTALATLVLPRWNLAVVVTAAALIGLWLDWLLMPLAEPVVVLHDRWLAGEVASLALCLVPAALLARWTADDRRLALRILGHVILFGALMLWILPAILLELTGGDWSAVGERPLWLNVVAAQVILVPAVLGISAVGEFYERGRGTPVPLDPPARLVKSGAYSYLANPMQVSMCLVFPAWGLYLESWVVALAGLMAVVFGLGLGWWATGRDLERRFGRRWHEYRSTVRAWWPSWRPRFVGETPARLYADLDCRPCRQVAEWIRSRRPAGLEIVPADRHDPPDLLRMTYEAGGGGGGGGGEPLYSARGVVALARALEHVHLGWALVGWIIRLPLLRTVLQVIVDAVGGGPRRPAGR